MTRFGAAGDGTTDCTAAFAAAIAACHRAGGGHVTVPAGTFLTGAIHLLSHTDLHLEQGSAILFSQDPNAYLPVVFSRWQGIELMNYSPFIYCYGQPNIAITGPARWTGRPTRTTGGTGRTWRPPDFTRWRRWPTATCRSASASSAPATTCRRTMIQPFASDTVLIEGVTIVNSPFWDLNPNLCTNVTVRGRHHPRPGPNNDGCDPESCCGVVIDRSPSTPATTASPSSPAATMMAAG